MHLKTGTSLKFGSYIIESVLGQGGFGITYMAVQTALDRKVAIKEFFMKEHCERDESTSSVSLGTSGSREMVLRFKNKFIREAQTIAKMNHPHIVRIHDVFEENGTAYYVMEYHGSGSLLSHSLPLSSAEVIAHAKQISSALAYLHKRKVMHLDVKPANVLVDEDGNAVLIDFGVSKRYDEEGHQTSSTPIGTSHGYAPIEQYSQTTLTFSPATDIYALGATMYKLLTGLTPPESSLLLSNPSLLSFPEDISSSLVALVRKCMRPVVDDRPQSIEEFLGLLEAAEVAMKAETESSESVTMEDETADEGVDDLVEGEKVADTLSETDETEVSEQAEEQTPHQSSSSDSASDGPSGPAPRKRRLWLWLLLLALVAGVLAAVVFTGKNDDAKKADAEQTAAPVPPMDQVDSSAIKAARLAAEQAAAKKAKEEEAARLAAEKKAMEEDERSRFESDYNEYKTAMEMGSEYEKIKPTWSQAKAKYESAQKIEQRWSNSSTYSSRFNLGASASLKRVEKRLSDIAAEAVAKEKAEEEAKKAEEAKRAAARTHGTLSSHQWVDLGLPSGLKWATCNVDASSPEDYGDYYAWGELSTKDEYTESNCSTYEKQIGNISGNPKYDVARAKWGGSWRMPTREEFEELIDNCTWEWTTKGGHKGYKVTGPNGNSIFLPAAGFRNGAGTYDAESYGYYWSATPNGSASQDAYDLSFNSGLRGSNWDYRSLGRSVRPVSD